MIKDITNDSSNYKVKEINLKLFFFGEEKEEFDDSNSSRKEMGYSCV